MSIANLLNGILSGIAGFVDGEDETTEQSILRKFPKGRAVGKNRERIDNLADGLRARPHPTPNNVHGFYADPASKTGYSYSNPKGVTVRNAQAPTGHEKVITNRGRVNAEDWAGYSPQQYSNPNVVADWAAFQPAIRNVAMFGGGIGGFRPPVIQHNDNPIGMIVPRPPVSVFPSTVQNIAAGGYYG